MLMLRVRVALQSLPPTATCKLLITWQAYNDDHEPLQVATVCVTATMERNVTTGDV